MRSSIPILGFFVMITLGLGCVTQPVAPITNIRPRPAHPVEPNTDVPKEWDMLPAESSTPLQIDDAVIHGSLKAGDKEKIAALVGRVKGIYHKAHDVTTAFDGSVVAAVAARIEAGNREVYCVRDIYGNWNILAVVQRWP